jgi:hypothetical protein
MQASRRMRTLIARRYESMEAAQGRAWTKFTFVVLRVDLPEWFCETRYEFARDNAARQRLPWVVCVYDLSACVPVDYTDD